MKSFESISLAAAVGIIFSACIYALEENSVKYFSNPTKVLKSLSAEAGGVLLQRSKRKVYSWVVDVSALNKAKRKHDDDDDESAENDQPSATATTAGPLIAAGRTKAPIVIGKPKEIKKKINIKPGVSFTYSGSGVHVEGSCFKGGKRIKCPGKATEKPRKKADSYEEGESAENTQRKFIPTTGKPLIAKSVSPKTKAPKVKKVKKPYGSSSKVKVMQPFFLPKGMKISDSAIIHDMEPPALKDDGIQVDYTVLKSQSEQRNGCVNSTGSKVKCIPIPVNDTIPDFDLILDDDPANKTEIKPHYENVIKRIFNVIVEDNAPPETQPHYAQVITEVPKKMFDGNAKIMPENKADSKPHYVQFMPEAPKGIFDAILEDDPDDLMETKPNYAGNFDGVVVADPGNKIEAKPQNTHTIPGIPTFICYHGLEIVSCDQDRLSFANTDDWNNEFYNAESNYDNDYDNGEDGQYTEFAEEKQYVTESGSRQYRYMKKPVLKKKRKKYIPLYKRVYVVTSSSEEEDKKRFIRSPGILPSSFYKSIQGIKKPSKLKNGTYTVIINPQQQMSYSGGSDADGAPICYDGDTVVDCFSQGAQTVQSPKGDGKKSVTQSRRRHNRIMKKHVPKKKRTKHTHLHKRLNVVRRRSEEVKKSPRFLPSSFYKNIKEIKKPPKPKNGTYTFIINAQQQMSYSGGSDADSAPICYDGETKVDCFSQGGRSVQSPKGDRTKITYNNGKDDQNINLADDKQNVKSQYQLRKTHFPKRKRKKHKRVQVETSSSEEGVKRRVIRTPGFLPSFFYRSIKKIKKPPKLKNNTYTIQVSPQQQMSYSVGSGANGSPICYDGDTEVDCFSNKVQTGQNRKGDRKKIKKKKKLKPKPVIISEESGEEISRNNEEEIEPSTESEQPIQIKKKKIKLKPKPDSEETEKVSPSAENEEIEPSTESEQPIQTRISRHIKCLDSQGNANIDCVPLKRSRSDSGENNRKDEAIVDKLQPTTMKKEKSLTFKQQHHHLHHTHLHNEERNSNSNNSNKTLFDSKYKRKPKKRSKHKRRRVLKTGDIK